MRNVSNKLLLAAAIAALLAGCDSGGIEIKPTTVDNSTNTGGNNGGNNGGNQNNPCASYSKGGVVRQGSFSDATGHCTYAPSFVDAGNNLTEDLYIPALEDGGAHIFEGHLFVGRNYDNDADLAAAGITEGGDGATLTLEAGVTIAFEDPANFMVINRGSQLVAIGKPNAPITITSKSDVDGTVGPEDVSQWGGLIINGFGITNKCGYEGSGSSLSTSNCHIIAEGSVGATQNNYGGANNDDNSGHLEYFVVKHTGFEVSEGDELNGITFNAVGRGTVVKNLQTYSTYDDGIEFFGGAVDIENYVALYVRDDSIDIDEGYSGTIKNALVIQAKGSGNSCIESDGIGSYQAGTNYSGLIAAGLNSRPVIDGLTCIISPGPNSIAGHGEGNGWRFREGIFPVVRNSLVIGSFLEDTTEGGNPCLRIEDAETLQAAEDGDLVLESNIFVCRDKVNGGPLPGGQSLLEWAEANGNVFADISGKVDATATADTGLQLLQGAPSVYSIDTSSMVVNDAPVGISPIERAYLGALSQGDSDWTQGWTYGLHEGNRAQPLWFEEE